MHPPSCDLSPLRVRLVTFAVMAVLAIAAICAIDRRAMTTQTPHSNEAPADGTP